jgi:hypothetical protein
MLALYGFGICASYILLVSGIQAAEVIPLEDLEGGDFDSSTVLQENAQSNIENTVTESITIQARIDGKSQLHLRGESAQWFHLDFGAPGRFILDGVETIAPTVINGVDWFPVWPDEPDLKNRDCNCFSNVFKGIVPGISNAASDFFLDNIEVRDKARFVQFPETENDYTLIIEFDDNDLGGNTDNIVKLTYTDEAFVINSGLNDAWYDPDTSGQGFFITVFPDIGYLSMAWFTYDTELPPEDATANLGDPGHRWLTAVGSFTGNQAIMQIEMTSGGIFDTSTEIQRTDPPGSDGTITLTFDHCNSGTVEYDITSIDMQGIVPIRRVANDNIVICEALSED